MESSTITASARAIDAATLTDALRRTAASNADVVALRTVDDSSSLTWRSCSSGSTRSPAGSPASASGAATRSR